MTHHQSPASPLPEAAEPHPNCPNAFICAGRCLGNRCAEAMEPIAAPSPVAQAPAQAGEVGAFEDWWYGHDGVRQRQVAYLGWPCTKELAESIWNGAREQAASSLPVALQQAREALAYHQAQTRPIDKTVDAIKAIDRLAALATPPAHPVLAPVVREPLTEAQINRIVAASEVYQYHPGGLIQFVRDIEAELGIQATTGEAS